jgi:hypothetical protein
LIYIVDNTIMGRSLAQIILKGHEYLAIEARRQNISFTKEGNCFTDARKKGTGYF